MTDNFAGKSWSFSFYFMYFAAVAALFTFVALFYEGQGLPGSQIGVLMAIGSLVSLFAGPLWSGMADASRRHRLVLSIAVIGNVAAMICYPFFHSFWAFFTLTVLQALFGAPVIPLVDNATMAMLGEQKKYYGLVRLGGTIGYMFAGPVAAYIVSVYGLQTTFWMYGVLMLGGLLTIQQLQFSQKPSESSFLKGVGQLLRDRNWIVFLVVVLVGGIGNGAISSYLFVYLEKIGVERSMMGWALTISTAAEVVIMLFASFLLIKLKARGLLVIGVAGTALRCLLFGMTGVPWIAFALQLLQFVGFPLLMVAGVSYADENAPAGMGATAQGIFNSALMGVGFAAGGFFGGVLIEKIGVQQMFFVFGVLGLGAAFLYAVLDRPEPIPQPA